MSIIAEKSRQMCLIPDELTFRHVFVYNTILKYRYTVFTSRLAFSSVSKNRNSILELNHKAWTLKEDP